MESGRGWARHWAAACLAVSVFIAGCGTPLAADAEPASAAPPTTAPVAAPTDGSSFETPDITARAITPTDLEGMVPAGGVTTVRSNEQLVLDSILDRDDQADDIVAHRRSTGLATELDTEHGPAFVWIDVLGSPEDAHSYLVDLTQDIAKRVDGTHDPLTAVEDVVEFAVDAGQEAVGLIGMLGDGRAETMVLSRVGRLVVFASVVMDGDGRVPVQYLIDQTVDQAMSTLTGDAIDLAASLAPTYRFQTTVDVDADDARWATDAVGTTTPDGRSCEVSRSTPDTDVTLELIEVDSSQWMRDTTDSPYSAVGSNAVVSELLTWCPGWPIELAATGLSGLTDAPDPARHHVNGVDASGYSGTDDVAAAALGLDAAAVEIDTFSFWVADRTDWVVEISIVASGSGTAMAPLIGTGFAGLAEVTVTLRHRVFDINDVGAVVAP